MECLRKIKADNITLKVTFKAMMYVGKKGTSKKAVEIIKAWEKLIFKKLLKILKINIYNFKYLIIYYHDLLLFLLE